eukprot:11198284-Lingulodinium_polyedra.AAC.1
MLVWWPVPNNIPQVAQSTSIYRAGTRFGDNRAGLFVWGNLSGDARVQAQARLSNKAGYVPSQAKLDTSLRVQGVGSGAQQ